MKEEAKIEIFLPFSLSFCRTETVQCSAGVFPSTSLSVSLTLTHLSLLSRLDLLKPPTREKSYRLGVVRRLSSPLLNLAFNLALTFQVKVQW